MPITPNMNLNIPDVSVTPGPEWAQKINDAITAIDSHTHTTGQGAEVPVSAIDVNQNFSLSNNELVDAAAVQFQNLLSTISGPSNINKFHVVNGNVWFTNAGGVPVQLTDGNSIVSNIVIPPSPLMPSGTVLDFAGSIPPAGFLLCDGSAVSRTTYSDLFAAIGTIWGVGDGSTTFNLPNFNGRTAVASGPYTDPVSGSVTRTVGQSIGAEAHVLTLPQIPSHNHGGGNHTHSYKTGNNFSYNGGNSGGFAVINTTESVGFSGDTISPQGGDTSHNNMQPSLVIIKMIKT